MFFNFDYKYKKEKKIIIVNFEGNLENDEELENFMESWLDLYRKKEFFIFIFNTINFKYASINHCLKLSFFLSKLKKAPIQYLKRSFIIINNVYLKYLLELLFTIQKPVSPVIIIDKNITPDKIIDEYQFEDNLEMN